MSKPFVHTLLAAFLLVVLVFAGTSGFLSPVLDAGRISVLYLGYPFVQVFTRADNFFGVISRLRELSSENAILNRQVEQLSAEAASLEKERQENRALREALGFQAQSKLRLIPAEVISMDALAADSRVTLNRGSSSGVDVQDAVVIAGNVMVGVIVAVSADTSQMDMVSSSQVAVNAMSSSGKATGIVRGEHGLGLLFDLVSQTEVINPGERVVTSGLSGLFPKSLLIGTIGEIRSSSSELFQRASVIPATNLRNLNVVFIVKK